MFAPYKLIYGLTPLWAADGVPRVEGTPTRWVPPVWLGWALMRHAGTGTQGPPAAGIQSKEIAPSRTGLYPWSL